MNRVATMNRGVENVRALDTVEVPSLEGKVSAEEWALRVDLAAAYRLVAYYGWDDLIFTHLSARVPGPEHHFLMNPYNLMFEEVTASSLVKIDVAGKPVDPTPFVTNPAGFTIHSAIHMAREDLMCVAHTHTAAGIAVSAQKQGLLPLSQQSMKFYNNIAYHGYEGIALDLDEREGLVADLGTHSAMILRNHGLLVGGKSVAEAFLTLYTLERSCQAQVAAMSGGAELIIPPVEVCEHARDQFAKQTEEHVAFAWEAALRLVDNEKPDYRS